MKKLFSLFALCLLSLNVMACGGDKNEVTFDPQPNDDIKLTQISQD